MSLILLVEGQDDLHVIRNLLFARGVALSREQLRDIGGDTALLDAFAATLVGGAYDVIAAVFDADSDASERWQSIRDRLRDTTYALPTEPGDRGTIVHGERTVGIWLMPNNGLPGKLEDFVRMLIPGGDELWMRAHAAVAAIPHGLRRFSATATIKAEIHTWLAWQEEPGTKMGAAITKRYLQGGGEAADAFVEWIQQLLAADHDNC